MTVPVNLNSTILSDRWVILLGSLFALVFSLGILFNTLWIGVIPLLILLVSYLLLYRLEWLYLSLFLLIPLSVEIELPGGLGTDLPAEPILWILTVATVCFVISKGVPRRLYNGTTLLLLLHIGWIFCVSIFAHDPVIALKYALAKTWYIIPFYVLTHYLISQKNMRSLLKCFVLGTLIGGCYFFFQHWQLDLSYLSRTNAGLPIWRNHVNYACTLVLNLPILLYLYTSSKHPDRWMYILLIALFSIFLYFSYTRIAYLSLVAVFGYWMILKWRGTKWAFILGVLVTLFAIYQVNDKNQYLHYAPDFDKAIMQADFENKLAATTQGEDISTMERLHRWVAGSKMVKERPVMGFGPGNFYSAYRPYTVYSFETYVSDNPDRSGIHNYYLMLMVEQGIIGLILFLALIYWALISIESFYHKTRSKESKQYYLLLGVLLIMMLLINSVNDMIETIKLGSFFFLVLALIYKNLRSEETSFTTT